MDDILFILGRIDAKLDLIIDQENEVMADLSDLTTAVADATTVEESAITLLESLAAQLEAAATDPAAVQALADSIRAESTKLADAVSANTPAAPTA